MNDSTERAKFIEIANCYGIASDVAVQLFDAWQKEDESGVKFNFLNVLYYFGGVLIILAMTWFITINWNVLGGWGIASIASLYMGLLGFLGYWLWYRHELKIPGGLLVTAAVAITPLAVYGVEQALGIWPNGSNLSTYHDYHIWIKGNWFFMEMATLVVGTIALYFIRFPFITAPMAVTLWYMSMDSTPLLFGQNSFTYEQSSIVSLLFGLFMLLLAFNIDRKTKEDYSFWIYLFGLLAFWGGVLTYILGKNEGWQFVWGATNLGLMLTSVLLQRKTFIVLGSMGFFGYLGHLAYEVFKVSMAFPLVLSLMGLMVIWVAIVYQKNKAAVETYLLNLVPEALKQYLPMYR